MAKAILLFVSILILNVGSAQQPPSLSRVFTMNTEAMKKSREAIKEKDPLYIIAFASLIKDAGKALKKTPPSVMEKKNFPPSGDKHDYMSLAPYFWPDSSKKDGLPYLRRDGVTNPEVKEYLDKVYMPQLCEDVQVLALAYYFTGKEMYAAKATDFIATWFLSEKTRMNPNLNFAQAIKGVNEGRGAGIIDSRHFLKVIDAIGIISASKSWKESYTKGMKTWFSQYLNWLETSPNGITEKATKNNHGTWYDAQRLAMAIFIDSTDKAKKIIQSAANRLDQQMDKDGSFPKELERTIALHYTVFNLEAFFHIAHMAEGLGLDFWNLSTPSGASLKKGFEAVAPYLLQRETWPGQQIKPFETEEGFPLLLKAAEKYNCEDCREYVKKEAPVKRGFTILYN